MSEPILTRQDRDSTAWLKLKAHLEDRLQKLRVQNDGRHGEKETSDIRGEIKAVKALIALDADPVVPSEEDKKFQNLD